MLQFLAGLFFAFWAGWFFDKSEVTDEGLDKGIFYVLFIVALGLLISLWFDISKTQPALIDFLSAIGLLVAGFSVNWIGYKTRRLVKP